MRDWKQRFQTMSLGFFMLLLLHQVFILKVAAEEPVVAKPDCQSKCGNVTIPFPFGIGEENCYLNRTFEIHCKHGKPILTQIELEVLEISVENGTMRVNHPVFRSCGQKNMNYSEMVSLTETPFFFSKSENMVIGFGCNNIIGMYYGNIHSTVFFVGGCLSSCLSNEDLKDEGVSYSCPGVKCCQIGVPSSFQSIYISAEPYNASLVIGGDRTDCRYGFLVEQAWLKDNQDKVPNEKKVPIVLDWGVDEPSFTRLKISEHINNSSSAACNGSTSLNIHTFNCRCSDGYHGNPYLEYGCTDIDECERFLSICPSPLKCKNSVGNYTCYYPVKSKSIKVIVLGVGISTSFAVLFITVMSWWLSISIKRRQVIKRKKEFFKRNGGLLLQQQLTAFNDRVDRCTLFTSDDLNKVTDNFNKNRILGQGGQGTVYKGMTTDGRIIAVKKSTIVDEWKLEEFINEVVILSQINHRNVVKLLGCCLETDVPLLVYEFVPNGTLFQYLHNQIEGVQFTWDMRLRIATEVAEALSYLHSAASVPIYHRDIKSANILLDEKLRAKVADFGTSKSFAIDQTHVTTKVIGTFGYLDPEYHQSGQLTGKSDVYSYGVVLVELLTGKKPMKLDRDGISISKFVASMEENCLYEILDTEVRSGKKEVVMTIAGLAQSCLNLDGKKRPTMKEVAIVLEKTRASQKRSEVEQNYDENKCDKTKIVELSDITYPSTSSTSATVGPSADDEEPLMMG